MYREMLFSVFPITDRVRHNLCTPHNTALWENRPLCIKILKISELFFSPSFLNLAPLTQMVDYYALFGIMDCDKSQKQNASNIYSLMIWHFQHEKNRHTPLYFFDFFGKFSAKIFPAVLLEKPSALLSLVQKQKALPLDGLPPQMRPLRLHVPRFQSPLHQSLCVHAQTMALVLKIFRP